MGIDTQAPPPTAPRSGRWAKVHPWAATVLVAGLVVSVLGAWSTHRATERASRAELERLAERSAEEIRLRFNKPVYGLNGARSAFAAYQSSLSRPAFAALVASRDMPREFPGVRGFGLIERWARSDLASLVAREQSDGAPQFALRQLGDNDHDDLYVIKFIEPASQNQGAMGLDVGSERQRRAAIVQAIDTGQPTIIGAITLVQDSRKTAGALLFRPVYKSGVPLNTVAERRQALAGVLYSPIVLAELLAGMPDVTSGLVDIDIYDAPAGAPLGKTIYDDDHVAKQSAAVQSTDVQRHYSTRLALPLPGRQMSLVVNSGPAFEASANVNARTPWLVLLAGMATTMLLFTLTRSLVRGRSDAEKLAVANAKEARELAEIVQYTSNTVVLADRAGRITWVNKGLYPQHWLQPGRSRRQDAG